MSDLEVKMSSTKAEELEDTRAEHSFDPRQQEELSDRIRRIVSFQQRPAKSRPY